MRELCILCENRIDKSDNIYICKNMPSNVQYFPENMEDELCKPISLTLCQCKYCGMLQILDDPIDYYKDSVRVFERSKALVTVRQNDYRKFVEGYNLKGKRIIEIGAGRGGFLKTLEEMNYNVKAFGIENNSDYVEYAKKEMGVNVFQGDPECLYEKMKGAPYDAFVCFSYPARLINPNKMVQNIYSHLTEEGLGMVVTLNAEHLFSPGGILEVTRDLVAYYSISTLSYLFEKNGFEILESGSEAEIYNYVIVKKRKKLLLSDYNNELDGLMTDIRRYIEDRKNNGKKIAIWCAGHFSLSLISMSKIGDYISYIIDSAPEKQGKYSPGSGVRVVAPDFFNKEPVDTIIIAGQLYIDEIADYIKKNMPSVSSLSFVNLGGINEIF